MAGGGCGWGIAVYRVDVDVDVTDDGGEGGSEQGRIVEGNGGGGNEGENREERNNLGSLRIYTSGAEAQAIWLLMFVASRAKIRRAEGVRWLDASGVVVVSMSS